MAELFFLAVLFLAVGEGEAVIDILIRFTQSLHELVVPIGVHRKHHILLAHIHSQFFLVGIVYDRGHVLDQKLAFDKAKLRNKMLAVDYVLRFCKHRDHEHDAENANENEQGRLQNVVEFFNAVGHEPINAHGDPCGAQHEHGDGDRNH